MPSTPSTGSGAPIRCALRHRQATCGSESRSGRCRVNSLRVTPRIGHGPTRAAVGPPTSPFRCVTRKTQALPGFRNAVTCATRKVSPAPCGKRKETVGIGRMGSRRQDPLAPTGLSAGVDLAPKGVAWPGFPQSNCAGEIVGTRALGTEPPTAPTEQRSGTSQAPGTAQGWGRWRALTTGAIPPARADGGTCERSMRRGDALRHQDSGAPRRCCTDV